eukprot:CAMPEP_0172722916 /NCGR_PEP_ID=MMETSP1074-20121228/82571_1 /TAXON_ID=2916 /ORGANISM="Ceratium fusus, Strain PA161109" /LENGTH=42 /DNA_ID= /DNA_START= /DNA_END= /DNA_ORIENTATION=
MLAYATPQAIAERHQGEFVRRSACRGVLQKTLWSENLRITPK